MNPEFFKANFTYFVYGLFLFFLLITLYQILRLSRKGPSNSNLYLYNSLPGVFTTIGVLGTFLGIFFGLQDFNTTDIENSIPSLLEGLKSAFLTSIIGIFLSILFNKLMKFQLGRVEAKHLKKKEVEEGLPEDETEILKSILNLHKQTFAKQEEQFNAIRLAIESNSNKPLEESLQHLNTTQLALKNGVLAQKDMLHLVHEGISGAQAGSLRSELVKMREQQLDIAAESKSNINWIINAMSENNELIAKKFEEFAKLLAENNTEALVEAMERSTEIFNEKMTQIVERLVQENFKELNNSVQQMNTWQQENKEMVNALVKQFNEVVNGFENSSSSIKSILKNTAKLTDKESDLVQLINMLKAVLIEDTQFKEIIHRLDEAITNIQGGANTFDTVTGKLSDSVAHMNQWQEGNIKTVKTLVEELGTATSSFGQASNHFEHSASNIEVITENTAQLTDKNSKLVQLINTLKGVMIDDDRFKDIVSKLTDSVHTVESNISAFDKTTNKLNDWVQNQINFNDSVAMLMVRLEEIDKIKDINEVFWSNTKAQLNEAIGMIKNANERLEKDVSNIDQVFYERLNATLASLDEVIQKGIRSYSKELS